MSKNKIESVSLNIREVINKRMFKTTYPDYQLRFNDWAIYIRQEVSKLNNKQLNTK